VPSDSFFDPQVHLIWSDINADAPSSPTVMRFALKATKNDPFKKGITVFLGRVRSELCPVSAMLAYMVSRGCQAAGLFSPSWMAGHSPSSNSC